MAYHMEQNSGLGNVFTLISCICSGFAIITWNGVLQALPAIASCVSIGAGLMAIRYYFFATKKQK